jgi:hypothetical protein
MRNGEWKMENATVSAPFFVSLRWQIASTGLDRRVRVGKNSVSADGGSLL